MTQPPLKWWQGLTRYQWFVFIVCCLAWDMDCMDQQLFVLARRPAMTALVPKVQPNDPRLPELMRVMSERAEKNKEALPAIEKVISAQQDGDISQAAGNATMYFMIGWSVGGIFFGIMGDRHGRVRTLKLTILLYALFTGLSALSQSTWDFNLYRFLTGLGVGGVFAAAVTLLAETVPERSRLYFLGLFQASSVIGNCAAALISMWFGKLQWSLAPWQMMFIVGVIPAFLIILIQLKLKEPEKWLAAKQAGELKRAGSYSLLLGDQRWRSRALFGLMLAIAGVIGLWGIAFFSPDLQQYVSEPIYQNEGIALGLSGNDLNKYVQGERTFWSGITSLVQNLGAFFGIYAFTLLTARLGRKLAFLIFLILAPLSTALVFLYLRERSDIFWMIPLMGFFQLALFGGYAIYFPELFPTHLRSTGTSFCYNVGRLISAFGPAALGLLTSSVFVSYPKPEPLRYAGLTMCAVYLLGILALPFLPETKDKPLPE